MKIHKIARHMYRDQLPQPFTVVYVAGYDALDQQRALLNYRTCPDDGGTRSDNHNFADRSLDPRPLVRLQGHPAFVSQEAFGEHCRLFSRLIDTGLTHNAKARCLIERSVVMTQVIFARCAFRFAPRFPAAAVLAARSHPHPNMAATTAIRSTIS